MRKNIAFIHKKGYSSIKHGLPEDYFPKEIEVSITESKNFVNFYTYIYDKILTIKTHKDCEEKHGFRFVLSFSYIQIGYKFNNTHKRYIYIKIDNPFDSSTFLIKYDLLQYLVNHHFIYNIKSKKNLIGEQTLYYFRIRFIKEPKYMEKLLRVYTLSNPF